MKKIKRILIAALVLLTAIPAYAVFNEKDLGQTLSVLRYELSQEVAKRETRQGRINSRNRSQHGTMVSTLKKCNELALMLYSQNQDYTFDMTYALKEVTRQYEAFNERKMPYDEIVTTLDLEIDRYSRLIESLRRLPPELRDIAEVPDSLKYSNDSIKSYVRPIMAPRRGSRERTVNGRRMMVDSLNARGTMSAFFLDEQGQIDRDSCIHYAAALLLMYQESKDRIIKDNEHYQDASARLKESYDYAQERYRVIQRRMFTKGTGNYFKTLRRFGSNWKRAYDDCVNKYSRTKAFDQTLAASEWRGPMVFGFLGIQFALLLVASLLSILIIRILRPRIKAMQSDDFKHRIPCLTLLCGSIIFWICLMIVPSAIDNNFFKVASSQLVTLAWLLIAILVSIIIRHKGSETTHRLRLYLPVILLGFLVMIFRVIFIPNRMMNIIFPPLLMATAIWQLVICLKNRHFESDADFVIGWISLFVLLGTTVLSWCGFVLLAVQIAIWWLFQIAAVEAVMAAGVLLRKFRENVLEHRIQENKRLRPTDLKEKRGDHIRVTWLFDFATQVAIPVASILSIPLSVYMALNVFDLTEISHTIFYTTFFDFTNADGKEIFKLSFYAIVLIFSLFFLFRYLSYAIKAAYKDLMIRHISQRQGKERVQANDLNLSLSDSVISILTWGTYVIMIVLLLRIPMGAVSIIAAGLATGLGLAMKDILNNFIYGIQLMSGRVRVGDWVECDGIRGRVTSLSYQSTQVETLDGAVMSFLNTALFNKNFKNLTRNNAYEFLKIIVGVSYGTDVEKVRTVLTEALQQLCTKDSFNRNIVDPKRGINVTFENFGESSVDLAVKQYVLVSERFGYTARAKEIIYDALNKNGITIPFPQRDIHIIGE